MKKMVKEGQSMLDFINYLPLQAIKIIRSPISNKEAQTLYDIWSNGDRDEYGGIIVPGNTDSTTIASLVSKSLIESRGSLASIVATNQRTVQISSKGKEVIKNIVLYKEKSAFEKQADKELDYESIFLASEQTGIKTANFEINPTDFYATDVRRLEGSLYELLDAVESSINTLKEIKITNRKIYLQEVVEQMRYHLEQIEFYGKYMGNIL